MTKIYQTTTLFFLLFNFSITYAQNVYTGLEAHQKIEGTSVIRESNISIVPSYIQFQSGRELTRDHIFVWLNKLYKFGSNCEFVLQSQSVDNIGFIHYRYQQTFNGIPIKNAIIIVHTKNDLVKSINGLAFDDLSTSSSASLTEVTALNVALNHVGATTYKWQLAEEEEHIKHESNDPNATYFPKGELVYVQENLYSNTLKLAYKFNIYAHQPVSRAWIYVDANSNQILFEDKIIKHADAVGSCTTGYSGTQTITTDSNNGSYRLRESGRGNGIETYDMNEGTIHANAVDFVDGNNVWNNVNSDLDQYATDAHWGSEMTYDYFWLEHGRNSIDGNGFTLKNYIHYDASYANAFWDGQRMTFGDGNGTTSTPFTALDVSGHEVSHGLTNFTANLVYQDEPGGLNESFSDIFGTCIENYARPTNWNWTMGEDIGVTLRSMSNPSIYNDPDTYQGNNWIPAGGPDNGGVHSNSGVQNFWFYLLTEGGIGTNDNGDNYNVTAQGFVKSSSITFRNLTVYLTSSSNYSDARFYAILSAVDLYGACSPEVEATTNAWYAVGVGGVYAPIVEANFLGLDTLFCSHPASVNFINMSSNGLTFIWNFGDNTSTSADVNPVHTYNGFGVFDVELITDGGNCGADTTTLTDYIHIDSTTPCDVNMPAIGAGDTQTACEGVLFDSGGPNEDYGDLQDASIVISPFGSDSVKINFDSFGIESGNGPTCNYDYLEVYDGSSINAPLIGTYCGNNLPPTSITSSGNALTLVFHSDQSINLSGFEISWECYVSSFPPVADFESNNTTNCNGVVQFSDLSTSGPTNWLWSFGDNTTSILQNPIHTYNSSGVYSVKLVTTNPQGSDSIFLIDYVTVNFIDEPTATGDQICENQTAELTSSSIGSGTQKWYDASTGGSLLYSGSNFLTPVLTTTTDYYVSDYEAGAAFNSGPASNAIGTGGYFSGDQHLIFDSESPLILKTVDVRTNSDGNRTIELRDATGTVIATKTIFLTAGLHTVSLDFDVPVATNLQLGVAFNSSPDMYRNSNGTNYPYTSINGLINITSSSAGSGLFYFFYNWEVEELGCESDRVSATAEVLPDFNLTMDAPNTLCEYEVPFIINSNVSGGTWSSDCNSNCINSNTGLFYPGNAGPGTWTISYTATDQCEKTITQTIEIESCLGIETTNNIINSIYPNPGKSMVNIQYDHNLVKNILITDISGKTLAKIATNSDQINYNFSGYAKGVYFISFADVNGKSMEVKKFIKQ